MRRRKKWNVCANAFNSSGTGMLFRLSIQHRPTPVPILCRQYRIYGRICTGNIDHRRQNILKFRYRRNEMLEWILDLDRKRGKQGAHTYTPLKIREKKNEKKKAAAKEKKKLLMLNNFSEALRYIYVHNQIVLNCFAIFLCIFSIVCSFPLSGSPYSSSFLSLGTQRERNVMQIRNYVFMFLRVKSVFIVPENVMMLISNVKWLSAELHIYVRCVIVYSWLSLFHLIQTDHVHIKEPSISQNRIACTRIVLTAICSCGHFSPFGSFERN